MIKFLVRLCAVMCAAALLLMFGARLLGEQREREWVAFGVQADPESKPLLYALDVPLQIEINVSRIWMRGEGCAGKQSAWSNDGRLAFRYGCSPAGEERIGVLDFISGEQTTLTPGDGTFWYLAWSNDGHLAFVSNATTHYEIMLANPRTGEMEVIYPFGNPSPHFWSRDGRLAFLAPTDAAPSTMNQVFIRERDGTVDAKTPPLSGLQLIGWSPDETRLAYSYGGPNVVLHILDVSTEAVINTFPLDNFIYPQAWAPDGRLTLADYSSPFTPKVLALDPSSGEQNELVYPPRLSGQSPLWTSDGQLAYITADYEGHFDLYLNGQQVSGKLSVIPALPAWAR